MKPFLLILTCLACQALAGCGCLSPAATRWPTLMPEGAEYARREAQVQDPFPDRIMGPDTATRPRDFINQRSEAQQAKDKFYSGFLRHQFGTRPSPTPTPGGAPVSPLPPGAYYDPNYYPAAVR